MNIQTVQLLPLACLLACSASWQNVVKYSPDTADHSVSVEVYRAILIPETEDHSPDTVAVQHSGPPPFGARASSDGVQVPEHWVDTLKHEVTVALSDLDWTRSADSADVTVAAESLGLLLLPAGADPPLDPKHPHHKLVWLSRPGFNRDSTIAAIRMDVWCGPICGSGQTLLLARQPGKRWRVWHSFLHVVS